MSQSLIHVYLYLRLVLAVMKTLPSAYPMMHACNVKLALQMWVTFVSQSTCAWWMREGAEEGGVADKTLNSLMPLVILVRY